MAIPTPVSGPAPGPAPAPGGDVTAPLNFYRPPDDPAAAPFNYVDALPPGQPQRNFSTTPHDTLIRDLRGREADFSLDRDAFQIVAPPPAAAAAEADFADDASIRRSYYPEVERILRAAVPDASRVHIFDHTVRRAAPDAPRAPVALVALVHLNQTAAAVAKRVRHYFPDEADHLLANSRYRLVNVWRPLTKGPVESFPLAFASTTSLDAADVVPIEHRYPSGYHGETAAIRHNPKQKWYYLSGMTADERVLLECFDSESLKPGSAIGGRVPHTAFADPRTRPDAESRASIEVRALVFGP